MTTTVEIKNNGPSPVSIHTQYLSDERTLTAVGCGQLEPGETFTAVCYKNQRFVIEERE